MFGSKKRLYCFPRIAPSSPCYQRSPELVNPEGCASSSRKVSREDLVIRRRVDRNFTSVLPFFLLRRLIDMNCYGKRCKSTEKEEAR